MGIGITGYGAVGDGKTVNAAVEIAKFDMNGDGRVTPMDALIILKIAVGTG